MAGLFVFALALRLVYLWEIHELPFVEFPMVDARSYDLWGRAIAEGDWWGDRVFYQAPAYPYFLGLVYTVFGPGGMVVQLVQAVLGAGSCVLACLATLRLFGARAALAAGLLLAAYPPALFFDGMIQKTSLGLFLATVLLAGLAAFPRRAGPWRAASLGVVAGLLALTRENALLFAVAIPAWMAVRDRGATRVAERGVHAAAFALGVALVLLPVGFRNLAVGDTFAITTSQLGPNFYIGNNPQATGLYAPLMPGRHTPDFEGSDARRAAEWASGRPLGAGEVSDYWLSRSLEWIARSPGDFARLLVQKLLFTLNDYEIPDTEDLYVHAEFSRLLAALLAVLHFGVLLPLASAGLVFAWREREPGGAAVLVAALALLFTGAVAVFYVWARYRFPLVPLLLPFAGLALARACALARTRDWRRLAAPAAALALGAALSNLPLFDREILSQTAWVNLGNAMLRNGRLAAADDYLERARSIPHESADLHFHLAALRLKQDRRHEAESHLRRMLELDETDYRGHRLLGQLLRDRGEREQANRHLRESVRLDPQRRRRGRPGAPLPAPEPR